MYDKRGNREWVHLKREPKEKGREAKSKPFGIRKFQTKKLQNASWFHYWVFYHSFYGRLPHCILYSR